MKNGLNRRQLISTGMGAALALGAGKLAMAAARKPKMKIGLILYTIRDYLQDVKDIPKTLEKVKTIGYDAIELTNVPVDNNLAKILQDLELQAVSAHASWDDMLNRPQKAIDQYKEVGCHHLVVSSLPGEFPRNGQGFEEFAKKGSEVAARLAEAGMTFGYHNHSFEFQKFDGKTGQEIMFDSGDPNVFNFEIDTYWVQHGGADPAQWIEKVSGRVPTVHMKDMAMIPQEGEYHPQQVFAEVGEGNLNWPAILKACDQSEVQYCIVEQDRCLRDPMESIAISLKNMKSWGLS